MNGAGIRTTKDGEFTVNSLRCILQNRAYIGEYHFGDYIIPDGMPQIISDELFDSAQAMFAKNKRGGSQAARKLDEDVTADYWLTGHLFCGKCGQSMQGGSGTSRHGYKCYYYYCKGHRKKTCDMKNKRKEPLERTTLYLLDELVNDSALQMLLANRCYEYYKTSIETAKRISIP